MRNRRNVRALRSGWVGEGSNNLAGEVEVRKKMGKRKNPFPKLPPPLPAGDAFTC